MATITIPRAGASDGALVVTAGLALTSLPASADLGAPTSTASRSVSRSPSPIPRLFGIRTGRHATFDRVVLDLRGGAPGYRVGYVKTVREDGSGKAVDLRGRALAAPGARRRDPPAPPRRAPAQTEREGAAQHGPTNREAQRGAPADQHWRSKDLGKCRAGSGSNCWAETRRRSAA